MLFYVIAMLFLGSINAQAESSSFNHALRGAVSVDVVFASSEIPLIGDPVQLTGKLRRPEGEGPFPAVVLLHGCGGIQAGRDTHWVQRLVEWGYVTMQVDSLKPRGRSNICTLGGRESADMLDRRVSDAIDARRYLAGMQFVKPESIGVLGWSNGGYTTLETLSRDTKERFRAAVAFYPACRRSLKNMGTPLLILIGTEDDWTPADNCVAMMPKGDSENEVTLKLYPGATHAFDSHGPKRMVRGFRGSHLLQHDPVAEADAVIQVEGFLARHLKKQEQGKTPIITSKDARQ